MTSRPLCAIVLSVAALVAIAAVAYVVQHSLYVRPAPRDLTPTGAEPVSAAPLAQPPAPAGAATSPDAGVPAVDPGWLSRTASAAGIDETALDAFARAELAAPRGCGIGWTTLAGIGWVESHHGTIGDRTLGADGRPSRPIIGVALDGEGPVAAIRATPESTAYHGDETWDHAIGPMQFLPSTWETWAADGDGDGVRDPHDLDDAALAAAGYLCAGGRDLTTGEGWTDAVLSYNPARVYVDDVHAAATAYADRSG